MLCLVTYKVVCTVILLARCTLMYTKPYHVMLGHIQGSNEV